MAAANIIKQKPAQQQGSSNKDSSKVTPGPKASAASTTEAGKQQSDNVPNPASVDPVLKDGKEKAIEKEPDVAPTRTHG